MTDAYAASGVNTEAGDLAVSLMKKAISETHGSRVFGTLGGFAGAMDVSFLKSYKQPILATSTDGVGTKVAIAQAIDKHDTIGQDLVGMVVDDIVVMGAKSLFMTDYIACGKLIPTRIAEIVLGIATACKQVDVALLGGETAEHPGLLGENDYDVAGAAVGAVEADNVLGPEKVKVGDVVLGLGSSGLHSNGFSLVRKIVADSNLDYRKSVSEFGSKSLGEELLVPTMLYTGILNSLLESDLGSYIHAMSHITGGGIAANLSRVLPVDVSLEVDRSSWSPLEVFRVLAEWGAYNLSDLEGTWNLGLGFALIVEAEKADAVRARLENLGTNCWQLGVIDKAGDTSGFITSAKGLDGGAVRLSGSYSA
jgi:phosphoribosylformylglycinamidine cyclo-ligase